MQPQQFKTLVRDIAQNLIQREQMIADYFPAYSLKITLEDAQAEAINLALMKTLKEVLP